MKKAVVFGGSGFAGSHVADALSDVGIETTIFDIFPSLHLRHDQKFMQGDVLDEQAAFSVIQGKDYVYHFAGQADIGIGFETPKKTLELNIMGTVNILEACRSCDIERFVFASTIYVYSDAGGFYRASKQACELAIEEYQKHFNVNYTILRYGSLYGPRADERNLIHRILKQAMLENNIKIGYGADEKRDYIHIYDAARMSVDILASDYNNSHVILAGSQRITRGELLEMVCEILGGNVEIQKIPSEVDRLHGHYRLTPFVFKPRVSKKIVSERYIDLGEGLLNCMEEVYEKYIAKEA